VIQFTYTCIVDTITPLQSPVPRFIMGMYQA
jgi:hypothetical protein